MKSHPKPPLKYDMEGLRYIMRELRDPETGCLWDIEQDFLGVVRYTIEEAYEVKDAILRKDFNDLADELGDLLLQPIFHAQIAEEMGLFNFDNVIHNICEKMIRRHPHVFADENGKVIENHKGLWKEIKAQEKALKPNKQKHYLDSISLQNALTHAQNLQAHAAKVGFDWPNAEMVIDKVQEEMDEFLNEVQNKDQAKMKEEFGDLIFSLVNYARHLGIDANEALEMTNQKFINRFNYIEDQFDIQNKSLEQASLNEMDQLWLEAKKFD